jgi:hypothetical protein
MQTLPPAMTAPCIEQQTFSTPGGPTWTGKLLASITLILLAGTQETHFDPGHGRRPKKSGANQKPGIGQSRAAERISKS